MAKNLEKTGKKLKKIKLAKNWKDSWEKLANEKWTRADEKSRKTGEKNTEKNERNIMTKYF